MKKIFIVIFCLIAQTAWADRLFSDLRDISQLVPSEVPHAKLIVDDMTAHPQKYFQAAPSEIYGVELFQAPRGEGDTWVIPVIALFTFDKSNLYFRKFEIRADTVIRSVTLIEEIPLASTEFSVEVGLIPRTLVLSDARHGIRKLFPLGVGGVDAVTVPGKVRLVTPLIKEGGLQKKYVIARRTNPSYFKGKPFIRISEKGGRGTAIGFHIQQNKVFVRGFDSHGCMRLRNKDLREFFQIIMQGPKLELPVNIGFYVSEKNDHPYPQFIQYYKAVKNFGSPSNPKIKRDSYGLVIMERIAGVPPIDRIVNGGVSFFLP